MAERERRAILQRAITVLKTDLEVSKILFKFNFFTIKKIENDFYEIRNNTI
jgi:hypothetical protein